MSRAVRPLESEAQGSACSATSSGSVSSRPSSAAMCRAVYLRCHVIWFQPVATTWRMVSSRHGFPMRTNLVMPASAMPRRRTCERHHCISSIVAFCAAAAACIAE
eukprot:CAMPEP_0179158378 /NCGR_PEP_ID=MMETSP0796-20121207/77277_1 /TAXON_ID=73915 /ORGANISM="Pyrodinium bahamense, Strain pbaha01" /LENGTH=104 /DNA_ID=CAMNT_0020860043 /DNA_START=36 /DNA_END=350 /DNA_ORIENTATION=+